MADGIVIIADCEVVAAGLLLGATHANCPAVIMPLGCDVNVDTAALLYNGKRVAGGKKQDVTEFALPSGCSAGFFLAAEGLGLCLSANGVVNSAAHMASAYGCGVEIVTRAKDVLAPKRYLTKESYQNALCLLLATGTSVDAMCYLNPLFVASGVKPSHTLAAELSAKVPRLADATSIVQVYKTLMNFVAKLVTKNAQFVSGDKLADAMEKCELSALETISNTSGTVLVKGTACEDGGYARIIDGVPVTFNGKAWVYQNILDADEALCKGNIPSGSVIVVHAKDQNVGALVYTIIGMGLQNQMAIVTDGICHTDSVLVVTACRPTALDNEAFANIQTGDVIDIDLAKGKLNTSILAKDMKVRAKRNSPKKDTIYFM